MSGAEWRPSASCRWIPCARSIELTRYVRPMAVGAAADEGTAIHALAAEAVLADRKLDPSICAEYCEIIDAYRAYIAALETPGCLREVEAWYSLDHLIPGSGGTVDLVLLHADGSIDVVDLKTGRLPVNADGNTQLGLYMSAVRREYPEQIGEMRVHIVQPRLDQIYTAVITPEQLDGLELAVKDAYAHRDSAPVPGAVQCKYCPAGGACVTRAKTNLAKISAAPEEWTEGKPVPLDHPLLMTLEQMSLLLDQAKEIKAWITSVEAYATNCVSSGDDIPGWHLGEGRKKRIWVDEQEVANRVKDIPEAYVHELRSPAQLEKLPCWDDVKDLVGTIAGRPTLKRDRDD